MGYSIIGMAVDLLPTNVEWMLRKLPVVAAVAEGSYRQAFSILPDASVDHIISNGAIPNLRREHQCDFLRHAAFRILRPGGTVWLGTLGLSYDDERPGSTTPAFWRKCLQGST